MLFSETLFQDGNTKKFDQFTNLLKRKLEWEEGGVQYFSNSGFQYPCLAVVTP